MQNAECRMKDGNAGAGRARRNRPDSAFCIHHSSFIISSRPGFTLLELIVVLLVLSVLFAMAAPSFSGFGAGRAAHQTASQIVTLARWAREQAISEGRVYRLNFDPVNGVYFVTAAVGPVFDRVGKDLGREFTVPEGVELMFEAPQQGGLAYLEFLPTGRCHPARIRVISRNGQATELASLSATEPLRVFSPEELQEAGLP